MKINVLVLLFCVSSLSLLGQCCPYIDSVVIIPSNPNDIEETQVILTVTTPGQGSFIYAYSEIENTSVSIAACYYSGPSAALQTYIDTVNLGVLPAGDYTYEFIAQQSGEIQNCVTSSSQILTGDFIVTVNNSVDDLEFAELTLYPNPVNNSIINFKSEYAIESVEIVDMQGAVVKVLKKDYEVESMEINLSGLKKAIYIANITLVSGKKITREIVIQ